MGSLREGAMEKTTAVTEDTQKGNIEMEKYKQEFIEFMVDCGVLKFGDFVTKSVTSN